MSIILLIIILAVCLLLEGFFSGSEMALVNADKYKLALATDAGSRRARFALHLIKHPAYFFSTTLLGTNLCVVTASVVATFFIIDRFGEPYAPLALLWWPATLIFGEIVPKSIYQHHADRIVLRVAPILLGISMLLYPAVWLLSKLTDLLLGGFKRRSAISAPVSREVLETMLEVGRYEASDVRPAERTMISRIFDLAEKKVENIMTPLVDVVAVPVTADRKRVMEALEKHGFSRVPVYEGQSFNITGVLTGTDLLFSAWDASVRNLMRPPYYVPEEMPLDDLLIAMKRRGEPLAIAVDEYGAATGIVTAEDLLEEVVGDIKDEHDREPALYQRVGRNRFLVSGRLEIEHANERLRLQIPEGDYETVAGYLICKMGRIPREGEELVFGNLSFIIKRATDRAVLEIEVVRKI